MYVFGICRTTLHWNGWAHTHTLIAALLLLLSKPTDSTTHRQPQNRFWTGQNKDGKLNFTLFNNNIYEIVCSHNINHIASFNSARTEGERVRERGREGESKRASQAASTFVLCSSLFFKYGRHYRIVNNKTRRVKWNNGGRQAAAAPTTTTKWKKISSIYKTLCEYLLTTHPECVYI